MASGMKAICEPRRATTSYIRNSPLRTEPSPNQLPAVMPASVTDFPEWAMHVSLTPGLAKRALTDADLNVGDSGLAGEGFTPRRPFSYLKAIRAL